jgi:hypothetical protein
MNNSTIYAILRGSATHGYSIENSKYYSTRKEAFAALKGHHERTNEYKSKYSWKEIIVSEINTDHDLGSFWGYDNGDFFRYKIVLLDKAE